MEILYRDGVMNEENCPCLFIDRAAKCFVALSREGDDMVWKSDSEKGKQDCHDNLPPKARVVKPISQ